MRTIVGTYRDLETAQAVVNDLMEVGFPQRRLSVVTSNTEGRYDDWLKQKETHVDSQKKGDDVSSGEGALVGGIEGGILGALLGLGAFIIPGIGPIVGFGPLIGGLIGLGAGAVTGGLTASLVDMGVSEDRAESYAEAVREGYVLVIANVKEDRDDEARQIMDDHQVVDLQKRSEVWHDKTDADKRDTNSEKKRARVSSFDYHEHTRDYRHHHDIYHKDSEHGYEYYEPAYRYGYAMAHDDRYRDRSWNEIEPELSSEWKERRGDSDSTWDEVKETVRYGWSRVKNSFDDDYHDYEDDFQRHYSIYRANTGNDFSYYRPGYRYGYMKGYDDDYRTQNWADVEPKMRRDWETHHEDDDSTWDDIKDTVRYAWNRVKNNHHNQPYHTYERDFREHYGYAFGDTGQGYRHYEPAYKYGYLKAYDDDYYGEKWQDVEPRMRKDWQQHRHEQDSTWDDVKDAVRYGWERMKLALSNHDDHDYDHDESAYRSHYKNNYANTDQNFDYYKPGYRYGYNARHANVYTDKEWRDIEPDLHREWDHREQDSTWDEVKDAVRHGWNRAKATIA